MLNFIRLNNPLFVGIYAIILIGSWQLGTQWHKVETSLDAVWDDAKVAFAVTISGSFDASKNPYSDQSLLNELAKSPRMVVVPQTLLIGETEDSNYIVQLGLKERFIPIYLHKIFRPDVLGGYDLEGVSNDGQYKFKGSINYSKQLAGMPGFDLKVDYVKTADGRTITEGIQKYCNSLSLVNAFNYPEESN